MLNKLSPTEKRARRTRGSLTKGDRARLSVSISNNHIYAQIIDDKKGITIVSASDKDVETKGKNMQSAKEVGELIAARAKEKKVGQVVFDRGGRRYHGKVKALAEGARKELTF